jgi:hypothetical protein
MYIHSYAELENCDSLLSQTSIYVETSFGFLCFKACIEAQTFSYLIFWQVFEIFVVF